MTEERSRAEQNRVDYDLLIRRLESAIGDEKGRERVKNLITRSSIWTDFPPEQAVKWAEIAAAVGETGIARTVLEYVTNRHPDCIAAWKARCDLLDKPQVTSEEKFDLDDSFDRYRNLERGLSKYMEIFRGREDCFARQWVDRNSGNYGYGPVRRPMTEQDVMDHLKGRRTYGIYLLQKDGQVRIGVIDADCRLLKDGAKLPSEEKRQIRDEAAYILKRLPELAAEFGLRTLCEFSGGKGYHFWFPVDEPVLPSKVRSLLGKIKKQLEVDLRFFTLEVFPKQDRLSGKGLGNLVKLPLGIHRLTGKRSFFIHERNKDLEAQLAFLNGVVPNSSEIFASSEVDGDSGDLLHPEQSTREKLYPELALLSKKCAALSHIITRSLAGRDITVREEKILLGTISFLKRGRTLMHHLLKALPDYNPYLVDYKLSRVRGTPLGCKTIHRLLGVTGDFCSFDAAGPYAHPLLHLPKDYLPEASEPVKAEKVENLQAALDMLRTAIETVERFLNRSRE